MSTPTTPKTPTPPTLPPGVTKVCHIVKRPDFDGYGFNLHSEKVKPGQFIGKVDENSPAEAAGLKEGDRILEVNGVSIGSETHKQVVARIKAIANEVRLLLIDVDGKANEMPPKSTSPTPASNGDATNNNNCSPPSYEGTKQELPGASANISSISVTSMKRVSNASSTQSGSTMNASDMDVVDRGVPVAPAPVVGVAPVSAQNGSKSPSNNNNNNSISSSSNNNNNSKMMSTPPPPSATVASMNNNGSVYSSSTTTSTTTNGTTNVMGNGNGSAMPTTPATGTNRAGSLNLPLTVAEMRAKLASRKKYDPKNESVDLKKKFEIIQKL
ncbi:PREDICTED: Na(+)/H(+) exchange regulatory cofactor NHE-RF1 [Drosophila arizonae]|uniref:Na(+)/H(+) exchange regulatory cofactor NHE-RF1 n=1 Tax=Drosophila arizonae TaxID=7263 RepID=A0ABM1PIA6_DROAR|nr:PREDICTED: Na(+)/H(+) exchange regulatory cofactor NHE-RF1 [Drosophila arizonae]